MRVYLVFAVLLNFLVDLLLLTGANRLCGFPAGLKRCALAAGLGSVYAAACLLPGFDFLGNILWRGVSLALVGAVAFGWNMGALRRTLVFVLLALALGGAASGIGNKSVLSLAVAALGIYLLCAVGLGGGIGQRQLVPVRLCYGKRQLQVLALCDTGNTLRDPVSGERVMVLGAQGAQRLTGLTKAQLGTPVETLGSGTVPGLRLLPYRTVGCAGGMLLALRLDSVEINGRKAGTLVAFAPEGLDTEGTYQALVGGMA